MIITGDDKETPKGQKLNPGVINQISNVVRNSKSDAEIETVTQTKSDSEIEIQTTPKTKSVKTTSQKAEKKRTYSDTVILNLPEGERSEFKSFCAKYQITMTDFIYFAMDYIRNGVEEKRFSLGRSGIRELNNE